MICVAVSQKNKYDQRILSMSLSKVMQMDRNKLSSPYSKKILVVILTSIYSPILQSLTNVVI